MNQRVTTVLGLLVAMPAIAAAQQSTVSSQDVSAQTVVAAPVAPVVPMTTLNAPTAAAGTQVSTAAPAPGPTVEAARVGIAPQKSEATDDHMSPQHVGAGQNVAFMVVGAAALVVGLLIGGGGGAAIAVGGAVVGLFGLYNFIQ